MTPSLLSRWKSLWLAQGLRYRLLGFFALCLIVSTAVTGFVVTITARQSIVDGILREQREAARRIGDRVTNHVGSVKTALASLAAGRNLAAFSAADQLLAIQQLMENYPDLMECALISPRGWETLKARRDGDDIVKTDGLVNRASREEFRLPKGGFQYVGPVFFTRRERVPQMFVAAPTNDGGVLLGRLSLDSVWDLVGEVTVGQTGHAFVVDAKGNLIAHPERDRVLAHENMAVRSVVREFLNNEPETLGTPAGGYHTHEDAAGAPTLAVHQRLPELGWGVIVQSPLSEALGPVRDMRRRAAAIVFLFGTFFVGLGLLLIRRILKPLESLQQGAKRIGRGDLSHRLDIRTGDEIQLLADEFNAMAASLESLEKTKTDLSHMIVHDLKSPLSGLLGCIEFVNSGVPGELNPEQKKVLSIGAKSGRELLRLVQNLLDIAKMEEGRLTLHRESLSLLQLAGECVDDLDTHIRREKKTVSLEVPKDLPPLYADRDIIARVLTNLLSNALRHTEEGGEIAVRAVLSADATAVLVSVQDNGEGIPPEFKDRIFEKFEQAHAKEKKLRAGTGLGLTFCKMAVEAHGGRIWVDSAPGKGSEFFVELPLVFAEMPLHTAVPQPIIEKF